MADRMSDRKNSADGLPPGPRMGKPQYNPGDSSLSSAVEFLNGPRNLHPKTEKMGYRDSNGRAKGKD